MNEHLTPLQQLGNLYDSVADDALDAPLDVDEETRQRANRVMAGAMASGIAKLPVHAVSETIAWVAENSTTLTEKTLEQPALKKAWKSLTHTASKLGKKLWERNREKQPK